MSMSVHALSLLVCSHLYGLVFNACVCMSVSVCALCVFVVCFSCVCDGLVF